MIAKMAEVMHDQYGYEVCGITRSVAEAVAPGRHHQISDLAVADLRRALRKLGIEISARVGGLGMVVILHADVAVEATAAWSRHTVPLPFARGFKRLPPAIAAPRASPDD